MEIDLKTEKEGSNVENIFSTISDFTANVHGNTDLFKEDMYVMGENNGEFIPLKYLFKKHKDLSDSSDLLKKGFIFDSYDFLEYGKFKNWYETQFSRKLTKKLSGQIYIIHLPLNKFIFEAIETVYKNYEVLRKEQILLNGKNLPVQLGEWFAKCIFGLRQKKSTSQRGFDFYLNESRVEVKVHWSDHSSPKGIKIKKSLVDLSDFCIIMYVARNFMIREICLLDSKFILRKFSGKGHTVFLKDTDINSYFFSRSKLHYNKIANSTALLKFVTPTFAMKIVEYFEEKA